MINKTTKLNFGKFSYTFLVLLLLASCNNTIEPTSQIQKPIEINTTTKKPVEKVSKEAEIPTIEISLLLKLATKASKREGVIYSVFDVYNENRILWNAPTIFEDKHYYIDLPPYSLLRQGKTKLLNNGTPIYTVLSSRGIDAGTWHVGLYGNLHSPDGFYFESDRLSRELDHYTLLKIGETQNDITITVDEYSYFEGVYYLKYNLTYQENKITLLGIVGGGSAGSSINLHYHQYLSINKLLEIVTLDVDTSDSTFVWEPFTEENYI